MYNYRLRAYVDCALTLGALNFDVQAHIGEDAESVFLAKLTEEQEGDFFWLKQESFEEITLEDLLDEWDENLVQTPAPEVFTITLLPDGLLPPPSVDEPDWLRQFVPYYNEKLICLTACEDISEKEEDA